MTIADTPRLMTTPELLALPEDGKERWLIDGQLREKGMTKRNHGHSRIAIKVGHLLLRWLESHRELGGEVIGGEAGFRLRRNPDTAVGIDVAYVSREVADANPDERRIVEGVPVLAVEVLSPSDKNEEIIEKVGAYLQAGVKLVWVIEPAFRTVTVYRGDGEPVLFNLTQTLDGLSDLPGLRIPVKEIFSR